MADKTSAPARVDVVVVSYCSRDTLRSCVAPLAGAPGVNVIVVDNASPDDAIATVGDLPALRTVLAGRNGGFSSGCNLGTAAGTAPYVLLLNPDAILQPDALGELVAMLERDDRIGLVAPKLLEPDGTVALSQRRFPRLRSSFAQALFLHRLVPRLDEIVREPSAYTASGAPEWVSGACMLIRRSALEEIGGMDEDFFLYCEDTDVCLRLREAGYGIRFEPSVCAKHIGGVSGPRDRLRPILACSRVTYARKHFRRPAAHVEAFAVALGEAVHAAVKLRRPEQVRGHLAALRAVVAGSRPVTPAPRPT